jgi:BirA family biotin operon repressor/biotin-[acetyl-CoA-carboxylase] ligase
VNAELIQRHAKLPSTQDLLHRIAEDGAPDGTVVVAAEQEKGRGQRGKEWYSPLGGLWMSVLVRPKAAAAGEVLSLRAGLAVARVLARFPTLPPISIKWPNDLFVDDKKIGGLLCEARWRGSELWWVAVGLGLNVVNEVPTEVAGWVATLGEYDRTITAESLVAPIGEELAALGGGGATLTAEERAEFATRHWLKGKRITAPVPGLVGGIAADGALLVALAEGGTMPVRSASVVVG